MDELKNPKLVNNNKSNESKFTSFKVKNELSDPKHNAFVGTEHIEIQTCRNEDSKEKSDPKKMIIIII